MRVPSRVVTTVLFTCAGQRVDIVRAFRAAGARTLGADADPLAPALYHADLQAIVPLIADPGYVDALADLVREHDVRLVVPLNDLDHPVLSRARDALDPAVVLLPDADVCDRMSDKLEAHRFFVERGIASPESWEPDEVPDDARYPAARQGAPGIRLAPHLPGSRSRAARLLPRLHDGALVRAGAVPRGGVLDRRLLRPRRPLPERDPAHDAPLQGRRVDQGRLAQGPGADRVRPPRGGDCRDQGPGQRPVLSRARRRACP